MIVWSPKMCEDCEKRPATIADDSDYIVRYCSVSIGGCFYPCGDDCCGFLMGEDYTLINELWKLHTK